MKGQGDFQMRLRYSPLDTPFGGAGLESRMALHGIFPMAFVSTVFGTLALASLATAQPATPSHICADVVEPADRLACYDRVFPPSAAVYEAAATRGQREFGREQKPVPLMNQESAVRPNPERIQSGVMEVAYHPNGARSITLDNGQAWSLLEATSRGHLAVGDRVEIRKAALGSYMLVTPAGVSLRARRIR